MFIAAWEDATNDNSGTRGLVEIDGDLAGNDEANHWANHHDKDPDNPGCTLNKARLSTYRIHLGVEGIHIGDQPIYLDR